MAAAQPFISGAHLQNRQPAQRRHGRRRFEAFIQPGSWPQSRRHLSRRMPSRRNRFRRPDRRRPKLHQGRCRPQPPLPDAREDDNLDAPPRAVAKAKEERMSITHKFNIGGHEGYLIVGLDPDGERGESSSRWERRLDGSGLMDSFALAVSVALQHGVPLRCSAKSSRTPASSPAMVEQSRHRLRQVDHGLHLPLAPVALMTGQQQFLFENLRRKQQSSPEA